MDLEKKEETENIEFTENQKIQIQGYYASVCNETVDDSWIEKEDKLLLLKHLNLLYSKKYEWANEILMKCLIKYHYNETIKNMNKEEYLKEQETIDIDDFIDRIK